MSPRHASFNKLGYFAGTGRQLLDRASQGFGILRLNQQSRHVVLDDFPATRLRQLMGNSLDELAGLIDRLGYGIRRIDGGLVTTFRLDEYLLVPRR